MDQSVTVSLTPQQAKTLIALFDNSYISEKAVSETMYYGLIAFRDQLLYDVGVSVGVDTNDSQQMGQLYRDVEKELLGKTEVSV